MALTVEKKEKLGEEMQQRKAYDTMLQHKAHIESKNKFANFQRYMYKQKEELDYEEETNQASAQSNMRQMGLERDERLAFELQRRKCEDFNEAIMRRQVRESAPELKELKSKLNAAYMNKILRAQMREKEAEKLKEKIRDKETGQLLLKSRVTEAEYQRELQENQIQQQVKYKQELQDQMIYQEQMKRFKYEEFLREKKFIDDLVQRIHEEDEREQYMKMCEMRRTREDIEAFKAAKAIWKNRNLKMIEEEDRKINEYIKQKIEAEQQRKIHKQREEEERAKIIDNMAKEIYTQRRKQTERQQIIEELHEQEQRHAFDRKNKEKMEKELRQRIETLSALHVQMQERKEAQRKAAEIDAAYKEELIAKIAEDNRLELLSQEKKRLKLMIIRRDVEQMIADKRQQKIEGMQELLKMEELEKIEEKKRSLLIEQERIRMLQEHAKNLIGYLPPGVLKESDMEHLGDEFATMLSCKQN